MCSNSKAENTNPVKLQRVLSLAQRRGDHFAQATWAEMRHLGKKKKKIRTMQSKKDKERMVAFLSHPAGRLYTNCLRQQFLSKQVATVPVEQACSDYFLFTKTSTHSAGQDRNLSVMHNFAMFSARNSLGMSQLPCTRQIWKATTPSSLPQRALFTHYFILPQNFSFSPDTTSTCGVNA